MDINKNLLTTSIVFSTPSRAHSSSPPALAQLAAASTPPEDAAWLLAHTCLPESIRTTLVMGLTPPEKLTGQEQRRANATMTQRATAVARAIPRTYDAAHREASDLAASLDIKQQCGDLGITPDDRWWED